MEEEKGRVGVKIVRKKKKKICWRRKTKGAKQGTSGEGKKWLHRRRGGSLPITEDRGIGKNEGDC